MDVVSHGLWGAAAFGRRDRMSFWLAFWFGVMPDILSFGIFFGMRILGLASGPEFQAGPPDPSTIPAYIHQLYDITHSFVVAFLAFGLVWLVNKKPRIELLAWPLHILVDIFTHSTEFFPTPFLWPFLSYRFDGVRWSNPYIFFSNWIALIVVYALIFVPKYFAKAKKKTDTKKNP